MSETATPNPHQTPPPIGGGYGAASNEEGKVAAVIVYILYIVGVFSANLISPIGVIVAYVTRGSASPWVRTHLDQQIRMFWTVFWWMVFLVVAGFVLLPLFGLGILVWIAAGIIWLIFTIWFAVKSFIGLMQLFNGREA